MLPAFCGCGAAAGAEYVFVFNVSEIKIEGVTLYEQDQILGVGGVSTGQNLVRTNTDIVEKRLKDTLVYLDDVKVTKKFPSTLVITCTEAEKAADIEYKIHTMCCLLRERYLKRKILLRQGIYLL